MDHVYYPKKSVKHYRVYKIINKLFLLIDTYLNKYSNILAVTLLFKINGEILCYKNSRKKTPKLFMSAKFGYNHNTYP